MKCINIQLEGNVEFNGAALRAPAVWSRGPVAGTPFTSMGETSLRPRGLGYATTTSLSPIADHAAVANQASPPRREPR